MDLLLHPHVAVSGQSEGGGTLPGAPCLALALAAHVKVCSGCIPAVCSLHPGRSPPPPHTHTPPPPGKSNFSVTSLKSTSALQGSFRRWW